MMKKIINFFVVIFILLLVGGAIGAYWAYDYYLAPMTSDGEAVTLTIERGASAMSVADTLSARGVVRSGKAFYYYLRYKDLTGRMMAGQFSFVKGEGVISAAERLLKPPLTVDVTVFVREGLTIEQTAGRVASLMDIDSAEFVRLCLDSTVIASVGISAKSLEGYLFPDTYRFPADASAETVIRRMVARFHEIMARVEWAPDIKAKYDTHQLITLAAIVEKEATLPSERGEIAGVFHNRLRLGWPLGADPTVRYIYRKFDGPLYKSELNNPSPYNTRRFAGLPPGPICSPGLGAIQASAKPDTTENMFFVAFWDGSGRHYFSKTNAEHDRMKLKVRRENEERLERLKRKKQ